MCSLPQASGAIVFFVTTFFHDVGLHRYNLFDAFCAVKPLCCNTARRLHYSPSGCETMPNQNRVARSQICVQFTFTFIKQHCIVCQKRITEDKIKVIDRDLYFVVGLCTGTYNNFVTATSFSSCLPSYMLTSVLQSLLSSDEVQLGRRGNYCTQSHL